MKKTTDKQEGEAPSGNKTLQDVLVQMNRPPLSADDQVLQSSDQRYNPFLYPSQGFQVSDLSPHYDDRQQNNNNTNNNSQAQGQEQQQPQAQLPEVLNVKLLSASEAAPDMAPPAAEPRSVVSNNNNNINQGTIVDLPPPLTQPKSKS